MHFIFLFENVYIYLSQLIEKTIIKMKSKEEIEKINAIVEHGDQAEISKKSGVATSTISLYLNGKLEVSERLETRILNAVAEVVEARRKQAEKSAKKIENLINQ